MSTQGCGICKHCHQSVGSWEWFCDECGIEDERELYTEIFSLRKKLYRVRAHLKHAHEAGACKYCDKLHPDHKKTLSRKEKPRR